MRRLHATTPEATRITTEVWKTGITKIDADRIAVRGYDLAELMGRMTFGQAVYLLFRGELPSDAIGRLMDAMLVAWIDDGAASPPAVAARTVASTGATISQAVATGVASFNRFHGGGIADGARQLRELTTYARQASLAIEDAASTCLAMLRERGERIAGFGHRRPSDDARPSRLLAYAREANVVGDHIRAAHAVERELADSGAAMPMNLDGAMAAVLADLGFEPATMSGIVMIARLPGLIAHVDEEQTRQHPLRAIDPVNHEYDGPTGRQL